jgi:hypothetical protein
LHRVWRGHSMWWHIRSRRCHDLFTQCRIWCQAP